METVHSGKNTQDGRTGEPNLADFCGKLSEIALCNPSLVFLHYRIEQILGIRAEGESLLRLSEQIESRCGYSFVENPTMFANELASREGVFQVSGTVTVHETYFFREEAHFDLLLRMLPDLVRLGRPIRICSAATSIGCEAYSIAMLLDYHMRSGGNGAFDFEIDAFDVDAASIRTAKAGRYTSNVIRPDGAGFRYVLDRYLRREGEEYVVDESLKEKVGFFTHNLIRGIRRKYDLVFFRNALIYFTPKNRVSVLRNLGEALTDNGVLFLGVCETAGNDYPTLARHSLNETFFFRKAVPTISGGPGGRELPRTGPGPIPESPVAGPVPSGRTVEPGPETGMPSSEIKDVLSRDGGKTGAKLVYAALTGSGGEERPSGSALAAAVLYFIGSGEREAAELTLAFLERTNSGPQPGFLRGELFLLAGERERARACFELAALKDRAFWPAFYRLAMLSGPDGGPEYAERAKAATESLAYGRNLGYECFLGGFDPDYFGRILLKKSDK
ncbi:MAG: hypothetical protein FWD94_00760 [Treponema sp.]|nr:hypothetical protein [Treponema sp.]